MAGPERLAENRDLLIIKTEGILGTYTQYVPHLFSVRHQKGDQPRYNGSAVLATITAAVGTRDLEKAGQSGPEDGM